MRTRRLGNFWEDIQITIHVALAVINFEMYRWLQDIIEMADRILLDLRYYKN